MKRVSLLFIVFFFFVVGCGKKDDVFESGMAAFNCSVTTQYVSAVTTSTAQSGGYANITSIEDFEINERGVCWSTAPNPTIDDNCTADGKGTGSFTSLITNLKEKTTYYVRAYISCEKGVAYGNEMTFVTLPATGVINGYNWVDLDLPSGLKWATCNVGANFTEDYGEYYAWGEIEEYLTLDSCLTCGVHMNDISGNSQHDVARNKWGSTWRMPNRDNFLELYNNCTLSWVTQNGVNGYKITSRINGNHIFLPAAGYSGTTYTVLVGSDGYYWSSTPVEDDTDLFSFYLEFDNRFFNVRRGNHNRCMGFTVRPVTE